MTRNVLRVTSTTTKRPSTVDVTLEAADSLPREAMLGPMPAGEEPSMEFFMPTRLHTDDGCALQHQDELHALGASCLVATERHA